MDNDEKEASSKKDIPNSRLEHKTLFIYPIYEKKKKRKKWLKSTPYS